jgi:hypothetical protein
MATFLGHRFDVAGCDGVVYAGAGDELYGERNAFVALQQDCFRCGRRAANAVLPEDPGSLNAFSG